MTDKFFEKTRAIERKYAGKVIRVFFVIAGLSFGCCGGNGFAEGGCAVLVDIKQDESDFQERLAAMNANEIRAEVRVREINECRAVNRFCGKCGSEMRPHANTNMCAFVCPKCNYTACPKLSPVVIVLITRGDKILLQRNSHYKHRAWTLVAGHVEAGETLEDALAGEGGGMSHANA